MKILYEDSQIIVCYKESGLPVQSARIGTKDLESILKNYLSCQNTQRELSEKPSYLGVVHRLDQPVEGILVFAKNQQAAANLSAQTGDGRMKKIYHAVVQLSEREIPEEGTLVNYLLKDGKSNTSRIVAENTKGAKRAELDYHILEPKIVTQPVLPGKIPENADIPMDEKEKLKIALVEVNLHTGRHHQIRVQMAGAGMPLLGDRKYGAENVFDQGKALALCAVSLELVHPRTGKKMQFTCEPKGEYFQVF